MRFGVCSDTHRAGHITGIIDGSGQKVEGEKRDIDTIPVTPVHDDRINDIPDMAVDRRTNRFARIPGTVIVCIHQREKVIGAVPDRERICTGCGERSRIDRQYIRTRDLVKKTDADCVAQGAVI